MEDDLDADLAQQLDSDSDAPKRKPMNAKQSKQNEEELMKNIKRKMTKAMSMLSPEQQEEIERKKQQELEF